MKAFLLAGLAAVSLSACATPGPDLVHTASGKPEGIFRNKTPEEVSATIAGNCLSGPGWSVSEVSDYRVVCTGPLDGARTMFLTAFGPRSAMPPRLNLTFTLLPMGKDTKAFVQAAAITTNGFGGSQEFPITGGEADNDMQRTLWNYGAERLNPA